MFEAFVASFIVKHIFVGTFFLMFLETIFPPIPSEMIMPFSGYLASYLNFSQAENLVLILSGNFGTTLGAVLIYLISLKFGRKFFVRFGKYFSVDRRKIRSSEKWFKRHGGKAVFLCRLVPGIRSLISIPAGLARMNFVKFLLLTFFGSLVWSSFLFYLGFAIGEYLKIARIVELVGALTVITIVSYVLFKKFLMKGT